MPKDTNLQNQTQLKTARKADPYLELASRTLGSDPQLQAAYAEFNAAVRRVNQLSRRFSTKNADNRYPVLDEKDVREMKAACSEAISQCTSLMTKSIAGGVKEDSVFYRALQKTARFISDDMMTMQKFEKGFTLPALIEAAHAQVIHVDRLDKGSAVGDQSNTRFALEITTLDGGQKVPKKGMFTARKDVLSPEAACDHLLRKAQEAGDTFTVNTLTELTGFVGGKKNFLQVMSFFGENPKTKLWGLSEEGSNNADIRSWYIRNIVTPMQENPESGIKQTFSDLMNDIYEHYSCPAFQSRFAGIPENARTDQRNSAMSAVADLLKRPELIAKSVPATVVTDDGQKIQGTFMSFAEGCDLDRLPKDSPIHNLKTTADLNTYEALRDIADLQVLDFICGNVDRHGRNMFYKVSPEGKLVGVQGIDNDMAFGIMSEKDMIYGRDRWKFPALAEMKFVNKEMANTLKTITPDILTSVLSHYGLSNQEITASCNRLQKLKSVIFSPKRNAEWKVETLTKEQLSQRVNSQNYLATLSIDDLDEAIANCPNTFSFAYSALSDAVDNVRNGQIRHSDAPHLTEASAYNESRNFDPAGYADKLDRQILRLEAKEQKALFGTQEYQNIVDYAKIARDQFRRMVQAPGNDLPQTDRDLTRTLLSNLSALSTAYLSRKYSDGSISKSDTASRRVAAMQELQDTAANYARRVAGDDAETYRLLSGLNREGAFDHKRDSAAIAAEIRRMKAVPLPAPGQIPTLRAEDVGLNTMKDGISRKAYVNMFADYSAELNRYAANLAPGALKDLVNETAAHITTLSASVLGGAQSGSDALTDMKQSFRTLRTSVSDTFTTLAGRMNDGPVEGAAVPNLLSLHGLDRLAEKLEADVMNPISYREQVADRLITQTYAGDRRQDPTSCLKTRDAFREAQDSLMSSAAFSMLTGARGTKALRELAAASPKDLLTSYNKKAADFTKIRQAERERQAKQVKAPRKKPVRHLQTEDPTLHA